MIRVTVELVPFGDENHKETLDVMEIWREHPEAPEMSEYGYRTRSGKRASHIAHARSLGFWHLVLQALQDLENS